MARRRALSPSRLPVRAAGGYDRDVVVIGAGPAGVAAAIRLRWLKGYEAIPASVALVDPAPPGGLAAMGGCVLTGPGWATNADGVLGALEADLLALEIPWVEARALSISHDAGLFRVALSTGDALTCRALILATGFRALHGEAEWFRRGVSITYKGYGFFDGLIASCAEEADGRGVAVIGHAATLDLLPLLAPHAVRAGGIELLLQPPCTPPESLPEGIVVRVGSTSGYDGDEAVRAVRFVGADGARRSVPVGAVLVDYHAFERTPEQGLSFNDPIRPSRDRRGFVEVDARMATSVEGIWAAGDVTGRYASTVMALGDGVCAAFSLYEWLHRRKFGCEPSLFAYAATGAVPGPGAPSPARFPLQDEWVVVHLHRSAPADLPDGASIGALRATLGGDTGPRVFSALFQRTITLHPPI